MTLAEQLIDEGRHKGKLEGKLEVAERLLSEGIELTFVAKMTGLSLEKLEALKEESY